MTDHRVKGVCDALMDHVNRERIATKNKAYREANPEKIAAWNKAYYAANRGEIATWMKAYYEANSEKVIDRMKAYREANPGKAAVWHQATRSANIAHLASVMPLQCKSCGYGFFPALDFHHLDPSQKDGGRDSMGRWLCFRLERFKAKIQSTSFKILCRNCHAYLHKQERDELVTVPTSFMMRQRANKAANLVYLSSIRPLKCEACGHSRSWDELECHHIDPDQKNHKNDIMGHWVKLKSKGFKAKVAANNFKILCRNCHAELHAEEGTKCLD